MNEASFDDFLQLLVTFDDAMLVTHAGHGELRARPMAIAACTGAGRLWFITHVDSDTISQITESPHANVCLQDGKRFLAISGTVRATRDPDRIRDLWTEGQRVWFEKGRDDPTLILLEIVPTYAEYWNRSGVAGVKFLLSEIAALVAGQTLTGDEGQHGKVDFEQDRGPQPRARAR